MGMHKKARTGCLGREWSDFYIRMFRRTGEVEGGPPDEGKGELAVSI